VRLRPNRGLLIFVVVVVLFLVILLLLGLARALQGLFAMTKERNVRGPIARQVRALPYRPRASPYPARL
jgi:hypothetical protein